MVGPAAVTTVTDFSSLEKFCKDLHVLLGDKAVLLLSGGLGAGKTKTVEYLLRTLGKADVSSPTFALHHQYVVRDFSVDHFDLYRIESDEELEGTGFWDVFQKKKGWVLIEWPEKANLSHLPKSWRQIALALEVQDHGSEVRRLYKITQL